MCCVARVNMHMHMDMDMDMHARTQLEFTSIHEEFCLLFESRITEALEKKCLANESHSWTLGNDTSATHLLSYTDYLIES